MSFFYYVIVAVLGYGLGFWDGRKGEAPPPMRGTYDSGEHDDRVEDYGDWQ